MVPKTPSMNESLNLINETEIEHMLNNRETKIMGYIIGFTLFFFGSGGKERIGSIRLEYIICGYFSFSSIKIHCYLGLVFFLLC